MFKSCGHLQFAEEIYAGIIFSFGNSYALIVANTSSINPQLLNQHEGSRQTAAVKWIPVPESWSLDASTTLISPAAFKISSDALFYITCCL